MSKLPYLAGGVLCLLLFIGACSEDNKSTSFDPNQPVTMTEFMPDSGGIRTQFVIKGSNFGNDKSQVKVFFTDVEEKEREAIVLGVNPSTIYCQVPKQADGRSAIRVTVNGKAANAIKKTFRYVVASSVSTVVGKATEAGSNNGTLGETTLYYPQYVAVDNDNNVFVFDTDNRTRLISVNENKSLTLFDGGVFDQPTFVNKEKTQFFIAGDNAGTGCYLFDAAVSWSPEPYGKLLNTGDWMHSIVLDPIDSTFVIYRQNTGPLWVQPYKKGMSKQQARQIGTVFSGGTNGLCAYNPMDGYIYCVLHQPSAILRFKVKRGSDGWPELDGEVENFCNNGFGFREGHISEAQFSSPHGLAIDKEGNIYIADSNNHRIRKIDFKTKNVTTAAGNGSAGYKDGAPEDAQFNQPWGVCLDKDEFIYIADKNNHCIRKLAIE